MATMSNMDSQADATAIWGGFSLPAGSALDICNRLQSAIIEHRIRPGAKLSEDEVGEIFGVSRTVARTSLQALAHGGLVTIERNRGAFVSRPSLREAHEVFEARALLEPRIGRLAAANMDAQAEARLKRHIEAEHRALAAGDKGRALALSGAFHAEIADIAGQGVYAGLLRQLLSRSSLIIALYWKRPDTTCERHSHDALVKALVNRDANAVEDIMKSHIVDLHSGLDLREQPASDLTLAQIFRN
jgi:DNA-binding GntR family transcriptional regulator